MNRKRKTWLIVSLIGLLLINVIYLIFGSDRPPVADITQCLKAMIQAKKAEANVYSPILFESAQQSWTILHTEWQKQNQKWLIERDFNRLQALASATIRTANQAKESALSNRERLKNSIRQELLLVQQEINEFRTNYANLPFEPNLRKNFATGEMLVSESQSAFLRGRYIQADSLLKAGKILILNINSKAKGMLMTYLENTQIWKKWAAETIKWSGENSGIAIIVDKLGHTCLVYQNAKIIAKYQAELGPNWIGNKRHCGDKATPEGRYFVTNKKKNGQTKYYKALLINYPNSADCKEFTLQKKNGRLPLSAQIGGLIEIHGCGGKGLNWTDGCVALTNEEMDILYEQASVGTPVTIVGSMNGINGTK